MSDDNGLYGRVSLKIPEHKNHHHLHDNPFSHPILGSIVSPLLPQKSNKFMVLRITRCRLSGRIAKISMVGFSNSICLFRGMRDH